jgi:hypothetical protein
MKQDGDDLTTRINKHRASQGLPDLEELRARRAGEPVGGWNASDLLPDLTSTYLDNRPKSATNAAVERVNEIWDQAEQTSEMLLRIYDAFPGLHRDEPNGRTQSIRAQCPQPSFHSNGDQNRSADYGINRNTGRWMLNCNRCGEGWDAGKLGKLLWPGLNFFEVKVQAAKQFYGYDYEAERASQEVPAPTPSSSSSSTAPPAETSPGRTEDEHRDELPDPWQRAVDERKNKKLIELHGDHAAVQEWKSGQFTPPPSSDDLEAELAEPDPEIEWTIEGLHSVGSNTTITAGFKVGKTTFMMNLTRALADQEPFLGRHDVRSLDGRIAYWNFEVDQAQMKRNFRDMGIKKAANVWHLPLRGRHLNLMDEAAYEWALAEMRRKEIEVWILDPWSGCYYGDENDNSQINAFTKRLDEFKEQAGIKDLFIPIHTGRYVEEGSERARGGAKIDDWTDNRWVLSKSTTDESRWIKAEGRRIELPNSELIYDRSNNGLTYSGFSGTKDQKTAKTLREKVYEFIRDNPGCPISDIENNVVGKGEDVRKAAKALIGTCDVETRKGKYNATLHYVYGTAPMAGRL